MPRVIRETPSRFFLFHFLGFNYTLVEGDSRCAVRSTATP